MNYVIESSKTQQFNLATRYEWLETNGLGGYASSTIIGTNTRRYHGLLVAALKPPVERAVMLSKIDETIWAYGRRHDLGCNKYKGAVYPTGYIFLQKFKKSLFPEFIYRVGNIEIKKTIVALNGENSTLIIYEVLKADEKFQIELSPLAHARDFHALDPGDSKPIHQIEFENDVLQYTSSSKYPELFLGAKGAKFEAHSEWYYQFEYSEELNRGQDAHEDLFSLGKLFFDLEEGSKIGIIATLENPEGRDVLELYEAEKRRRLSIVKNASHPFHKSLLLAGDQFIVKRDNDLRSIIAGYHWFSDWGRDTMISLPGLCLSTGKFEEAKKILRAFTEQLKEGIIPNRFSDYEEEPLYNTVDATLWFFVALYHYLKYTGDDAFVRDYMLPVMHEIIYYHQRGTQFHIKVDEDGLLQAGSPGVQLTWMDAKVGDWVVTPREGKAVEINALWYNALRIYAYMNGKFGDHKKAAEMEQLAESTRLRFEQVFWNEDRGCLFDLVNDQGKDSSIRPNQLLAISLPYPLLNRTKARLLLDVVSKELYTPVGLRSLSILDERHKMTYEGDRVSRDGSYHQGTVWSWLLGPYIDAHMYVMGEYGVYYAEEVIKNIAPHLKDAGVGNISEIFDSEEPHHSRGCVAQAWSVAELLRVMYQYNLFLQPQVKAAPEMIISKKQLHTTRLEIATLP